MLDHTILQQMPSGSGMSELIITMLLRSAVPFRFEDELVDGELYRLHAGDGTKPSRLVSSACSKAS